MGEAVENGHLTNAASIHELFDDAGKRLPVVGMKLPLVLAVAGIVMIDDLQFAHSEALH